MKKLLLIISLLIPSIGFAQTYSIDWHKVAGGGGTSTGGVYSASGTIGQHEAGPPMTGGSFSLTGGFWSLYALQTPGAPRLSIRLTTTNTAIVFWPATAAGFLLQQNTNLATTNWVSNGQTPSNDGTNKSVLITPVTGNLYFRLKQ